MNPLFLIAGAATLYLVKRALDLNSLASNITVKITQLRIHKADFTGLTLAVVAAINNPTQVHVSIHNLIVRMYAKSELIAESPSEGKQFSIAPLKVTDTPELLLSIGWQHIISLMGLSFNLKSIQKLISIFTQKGKKDPFKLVKQPLTMICLFNADGILIQTPSIQLN